MTAYDYTSGGFPSSPATDDTLTIRGTTYKYNGSAWEVVDGIGGPLNPTGVVSGRYYTGLFDSGTASATNLPTTSVMYLPVMVHEDCTIDELCVTINGGTGTSGDLAQMAFYGPVPDDLGSTPKLVTTATFAVDSGYGKILSITPLTLTKGIYLYAITANTATLSVRTYANQSKFMNHMVGVSGATFHGGCYGSQWAQNTVTTWPHSFPATVSPSQTAHSAECWQFKYGVQ